MFGAPFPPSSRILNGVPRSDASLSKDGRLLAVSNTASGFALFSMKGLVEIELVLSFHQDVSARLPLPVRFLHDDHAVIGGTSHGEVNLWDVRSRGKQTMRLECRYLVTCPLFLIYLSRL